MKPCQMDWQKLVFPEKINSVQEKLSSLMKIKQNEKSTFIYILNVYQLHSHHDNKHKHLIKLTFSFKDYLKYNYSATTLLFLSL